MKIRFLVGSLLCLVSAAGAQWNAAQLAEATAGVVPTATVDDHVYSAPPLLASTPAATLASGREALTDRKYSEAIAALTKAAQAGENTDEALLLLGNAHLLAKEYALAIAAYDRLLEQAPESKWRKKALFQKADAHAAQKQWPEAAAIYEKEMEYIVSDARREQIAATYLKYAELFYAPKDESAAAQPAAPDFARAKALFQKALEIGLTPTRTGEVLLRIGLADFGAKKYNEAIPAFERVRREHPQSAAAADALFYIGLSRLKMGDGRGARRALRDFLLDYPAHEKRAEATLAIAESWQVPSPRNSRELELGVAALRDFLEKFPDHERALQAEYWIGLSYFNRARFEDAMREWEAFIARHRNNDSEELALAKNQLGTAYLRQKKFPEAIAAWEKFLAEHPVHRQWNEVQRQLIDAHYAIGEQAYKEKEYEAARSAWDAFTQKYPLDVRNADIMFRLGVMQQEAGKYDDAIAQWRRVVSKYSGSEAASRAQYMIALTCEKIDKWENAFAALKLVEGKWKPEALTRLNTLKARRLVVYTERAFTSRDTPTLRLVMRNVPRVSLRAYRVDLRDYFSKTQTIRDVDKLDLNLIAPDQSWTIDTEKYAAYRETETTIPLPFKGAGVWAVVCRALPADGENEVTPAAAAPSTGTLEATSVVLVTDVGIITKSTKNDVFVWSQNLVTGAPVANAQVLVSNGEKIVTRGETNDEGVFHFVRPREEAGADTTPTPAKPGQKPKVQPVSARSASAAKVEFPEDAIRVLAVKASGSNNHFASTEGSLQAVAQVASLAPTGVLFSDRPLYRAGQTVHLKGIVRQTKNGRYDYAPGAEYLLQVMSPSGATVLSKKVALNEWGTVSENLELAEDAASGGYQMSLTRPNEQAGAPQQPLAVGGGFTVAAYQLDKVRLQIELPKHVFLRGEEIKGKVVAKYYYGEPLRNRKIRFGWKDNVGTEYSTGDNGEFEFTVPTRDFEEDEAIRFWARFDDEGASTTTVAYVASVGVNLSLSTLRNVYLTGEPFDVEVAANDLANKPFAGTFKLRALKIEKSDDNKTGEREVLVQPAITADGKAKANLQLKESGDYILRLEGKDANGNPVSQEISVQVVGDDEDVRLRLLPETDSLKVGDQAAVRVLWRGPKADEKTASAPANETLALVTYEADRIYGHQLVKLARGENTIHIPVSAPLAPAFRLSVSLMNGDRLHQASKWFAASRDLQVEVKALRADGTLLENDAALRPGEKVRVQVTTRDQNGKAVPAELSLAAVDEALLLAAGDRRIPIQAFLGRRVPTDAPVLTTASNTFNFAAEARQRVFEVREAEKFFRVQLAAAEYPNVPLDHWSYNAFNTLGQAGVIEGFPSGQYNGNRAMTRYEMAVGVARLLQSSGDANEASGSRAKLAQPQLRDAVDALSREFKSELAALGVNRGDLENRVTALENRVANAPRVAVTPSVLHRTGTASYLDRQRTLHAQGLLYDNDLAPTDQLSFGQHQGAFNVGNSLAPPGPAGALGPQGVQLLQRPVVLTSSTEGIGGQVGESQNSFFISELVVRQNFAETAFWNAHLTTDASGQASSEFVVPDSLTSWRVTAKGISKDSLAGEADDSFASRRPFWVELQSPPILQAGDSAGISAVVHNDSNAPVQATVALRIGYDGSENAAETQTITVPANASEEARFDISVPDARSAKLALSATVGGERDGEERVLAVRAWGIDQTASASGLAQGDREVEVKLPEAKYSSGKMTVTVGPHAPSALLDIAANPTGFGWRAPLAEGAALRLLANVEAAKYLKQSGGDTPRYERLSRDIQALAARLTTAQNSDGGWSWTLPKVAPVPSGAQVRNRPNTNNNASRPATPRRPERPSELQISAEAFAALSGARDLGFEVSEDTLNEANAFLQKRYQSGGSADDASKAMIVWAQSKGSNAEFAHANRLYRLRNSLDSRSLAFLSLALHQMARDEMAREVLQLLLSRTSEEALRAAITKPVESASPLALDLRRAEELALAAWATSQIEAGSTMISPMSQLLWAQRNGRDWSTLRATSYAVVALLNYAQATRLQPEKYQLTVAVNGKKLQTLQVDSNATQTTFDVPAELVQTPNSKVSFDLEGRGTFAYSVVLDGWTQDGLFNDEQVKPRKISDDPEQWERSAPPATTGWSLNRAYRPAPMMWNGKVVPSGFSHVSKVQSWDNIANEVRVGERARVSLNWYLPYDKREEVGQTVVLREPLPAGARVLEESVSGSFERFEVGDREVTFYFANNYHGSVSYDVTGARPGSYRVLPAKVSSFNRPGNYAFSTLKNFRVLPRGAQGTDEYRITPDEMYWIGKWSFDRAQEQIAKGQEPEAADLQTAQKYLTELFNRDADPKDWKLAAAAGKDIARMLFSLALRNDDAPATVRFFEVLRERFPDLVIPFGEIVRTAKAYGAIGEVEREVQVLRATAEASFRRETGVAGTLVEQNEHRASYEYLAGRVREYPDLANVESTIYTLAQTIAQRAEQFNKQNKTAESQEFSEMASATMRDFLILYPENPVADEASFALAVNLTEQGKFAEAIDWARRAKARYLTTAFADDYDYIITFASFLDERYDDALKAAQYLATTEYLESNDEQAEKALSAYRPFAQYIAAQIHHSRGELETATEYYRLVSEQFPDAREAADFFEQQSLQMPEVTVARPGEATQIKITGRNVDRVQVAAYKVDLLQFYQERRNLLDLGKMNLAGIAPAWQGEVVFADASTGEKKKKDADAARRQKFAAITRTVSLPLPEKGAYFVTAQADGGRPTVSGVVVRSSLEIGVQEDVESGRVRVNVARAEKNGTQALVQPKVEVWAVGSGNDEFRKGSTDLRGLVALDDLRGRTTVIAHKDGEYAFYRGDTILQPNLSTSIGQVRLDITKPTQQPSGKATQKDDFKSQARDAYMMNQNEITNRNAESLQGKMKGGFGSGGVAAGMAY